MPGKDSDGVFIPRNMSVLLNSAFKNDGGSPYVI